MKRILVACEESQAVTIEMRKLGLHAISCDLEPCTGGHPEWHYQGDVLPLLQEEWSMVIAFPPCTHLCVSGARYFAKKRADGRQQAAEAFFLQFTKLSCPWAIENPVGIMSTKYRKPDQIVQPWQFGDEVQKTTCLWLSQLPLLEPTDMVGKGEFIEYSPGRKMSKWMFDKWDDGAARSKTFPEIAKAMATQWGPCA